MKIRIEIEKSSIKILLLDKEKTVEQVTFPEERNLSEKLLPTIDQLLKKNKLEPKDVEKMELETDLDDSRTTYRIAKSIVESFNWSVKKL